MAEPVDPGGDFSAVTGDKEAVTVRRVDRQDGSTLTQATGIEANRLRPALATEGTPDGGGVPVGRLAWQVRSDQAALAAAFPAGIAKGFQLVTAAGEVWVVDRLTAPKAGEPYVCETVRLRGV